MIKIGVVGVGKMGKIRIDTIKRNNSFELLGIFDGMLDPMADEYRSLNIFSSFEELLHSGIDAIVLSTINSLSAAYAVEALNAGIHVFCEKPPARNCQELQLVMMAEKKSNCVLKYGFNHRYHYSVIEAKKIIESSVMGDLLWARGVYGKAGSIDYGSNWRNYKHNSGGGILIDQGIHMLDLMMHLTKKKFHLRSSILKKCYWDVEVEDNAFLMLESGQVVATLHSSANQWRHKFLLELFFSEGYIILDGILSESRSYTPETLTVGMREFENITFAMGKPAEKVTWFEYDHSWEMELDEFQRAILDRTIPINGNSAEAFAVMQIVDDAYKKSGFYE